MLGQQVEHAQEIAIAVIESEANDAGCGIGLCEGERLCQPAQNPAVETKSCPLTVDQVTRHGKEAAGTRFRRRVVHQHGQRRRSAHHPGSGFWRWAAGRCKLDDSVPEAKEAVPAEAAYTRE